MTSFYLSTNIKFKFYFPTLLKFTICISPYIKSETLIMWEKKRFDGQRNFFYGSGFVVTREEGERWSDLVCFGLDMV